MPDAFAARAASPTPLRGCTTNASPITRHAVLRTEAVATGPAEKLSERGYEVARRIPPKRDSAIVASVERQIGSALSWFEELAPAPWLPGDQMSRADVTTAIAFAYMEAKRLLDCRLSPVLDAYCRHCEALSQYARAVYSPSKVEQSGWYRVT